MISSEGNLHNNAPPAVAVFASGTGRTLENLARACETGELPARVGLVVTDRPGIGAIQVATRARVPVTELDWKRCGGAERFAEAAFAAAGEHGCVAVLLAGFLRLLRIPDAWRGRVLNIHPALLPLFGGKGMHGDRVHEAVLASGMRVSGCTVHYADDRYDHGPIILQSAVEVRPDDDVASLAARVHEAENKTYPRAARMHLEGKVRLEGGRASWTVD